MPHAQGAEALVRQSAAHVKQRALSLGFDLVGIMDPAELGALRPEVAWCQSVVVMAYASPDAVLDVCFRMEYGGTRKWSKWIYEIVDSRALHVCMMLRDHGFRALGTRREDLIDLKKAAVLAGLGDLGRNNLLVTERFGPRVRLVGVFTDAALEVDRRLDSSLCDQCGLCLDVCPFDAITETGFVRSRCVGGRGGFDQPKDVVEKQKVVETWLSDHTFIQCIRCMDVCPAGSVRL
jgi:ferredoxin